jgi:hypothetical protein
MLLLAYKMDERTIVQSVHLTPTTWTEVEYLRIVAIVQNVVLNMLKMLVVIRVLSQKFNKFGSIYLQKSAKL